MELSCISKSIIKIIDEKYSDFFDEECLDITQIKNICNLYKVKLEDHNSIELNDINFSSPNFEKYNSKSQTKKQTEILKSKEFTEKYSFFIKQLYACLKMNIEIFNIYDGIVTLKNNYQLIKALETTKKEIINDHQVVLKNQHKNISRLLDQKYEIFVHNYIRRIKIIDKISISISKLIQNEVFDKTDNLLTLILPYFYSYSEFIEEYN